MKVACCFHFTYGVSRSFLFFNCILSTSFFIYCLCDIFHLTSKNCQRHSKLICTCTHSYKILSEQMKLPSMNDWNLSRCVIPNKISNLLRQFHYAPEIKRKRGQSKNFLDFPLLF